MSYKIFEYDSFLKPFERDIELRAELYASKLLELTGGEGSLKEFANGHNYFGFHKTKRGWYYREWAPAADALWLMGDMNGWDRTSLPLKKLEGGVWEIFMSGTDSLWNGCKVKTLVQHAGAVTEHIPLYARRVVQDPVTYTWCAEIVDTPAYKWKKRVFNPPKTPLIYECHIGMAQEEPRIGSYREFADKILPRIKSLGYNTIQIMAIMEHPYYGSFGYQVSNFFAACSRYGTPDELKELIDRAHGMGIAVLLDVIHSHAVKNTAEGINLFDGTTCQFFHEGERGEHPAWGTKLFNYGKNEVIHFLLSNLKFWLEEYRFDGFRFDGVTSMIYHDHGLGTAFTDYSKYFSMNTDTEAITYLQLANALIREVKPKALTIAEDMSAMPGMCLPIEEGGIGFDYRLAMGVPDLWIKLIKETRDEDWDMFRIWHELTSRRPAEKYIGYAESHDQALVGDKTIMFRLCDSEMYTSMSKLSAPSPIIDRGMALHKLIRMVTLTLAGEGYLNFMGNEFGHPEWIDFPREGNGWSYHYCRRQWSLAENPDLHYGELEEFDRTLVSAAAGKFFEKPAESTYIDNEKKILVYERGGLIFALNFHPTNSYTDYFIRTRASGSYAVRFSSDDYLYGGHGRVAHDCSYSALPTDDGVMGFKIYLPSRTGVCLGKVTKKK